MRGDDDRQAEMLLALTPDQLVPSDHPIRRIKPIVEGVLARLSPLFDDMYADRGRPSIPPEHLLKASLLIALYSIRSERQFCERLRYDLLFKWFLDLNIADPGFDVSTFSKNRERLLDHDVAGAFFSEVVAEAKRRRLLSAEHFTVDGTLLEAWASLKSYRPRDEQDRPGAGGGRNPEVDFRGERRSRETQCLQHRPGGAALQEGDEPGGEALLHGAPAHRAPPRAGGGCRADRGERHRRARGGAGDAGAQHDWWCHAGGGQGLRHARLRGGATRTQRDPARGPERQPSPQRSRPPHHPARRVPAQPAGRKLVEQVYGWTKTVGGGRKLRFVGLDRNRCWLEFTAGAYNLVRMARLETAPL